MTMSGSNVAKMSSEWPVFHPSSIWRPSASADTLTTVAASLGAQARPCPGAELLRDLFRGVDRDREPDADRAAAPGRLDLRGDADHPALAVDQRPARVARIDRSVGLNRVV